MASPRLVHGFVFVKHLEPMIQFYENALGMTASNTADQGFVRMAPAGGGPGVALHALPPGIADDIEIENPPVIRDNTAYKLCFATDDFDALRTAIQVHGGQAADPWSWEGRRHCECADPEGNVIQIIEG